MAPLLPGWFAHLDEGSKTAVLTCCSEAQTVLLVDYLLYAVACLLLWHSRMLLPLKLLTVFLHELGHAMAAWLACAKVHGIEVHANQGGLTHWSARPSRVKCAQHLVLPAGYLGSAALGGAILVACARPLTTQTAAVALMFFLLVSLTYSLCGGKSEKREMTLPVLCLGLLALLAVLLGVCHLTTWPYGHLLLNKVLLLVAVMNTLFATYDIWEDCVERTVERSDAYRYAQLLACPCAGPRCVGAVWLLLSVAMAAAALLLALLWTPPGPKMRNLADLSKFSWLCIAVPAAVLASALGFRLFCSQTYAKARGTRGLVLPPELQALATADDEVHLTTGTHWLGPASVGMGEDWDEEEDEEEDGVSSTASSEEGVGCI